MDGNHNPLGVLIAPANEHEVDYVECLLKTPVVPFLEQSRSRYDGVTGNNLLRKRQADRGMDLTCSHCGIHVKPLIQDGRKRRRHRHRWRIGRTDA